jgi:CheY-like chemotaxis protein
MEGNKLSYEELKNRIADLKQKVEELTLLLEETHEVSRKPVTVKVLQNPGGYPSMNPDMVHSVMHKIKTPLDTIVGLAKLLSTAKLDFEEKNNFAEIINNCSNELQGAFSEFMSFNSLQQNEIKVVSENVSLNEMMDDLKVKFLNQVFYKGLTFKSVKGLSDDDDTVMIDKNIVTHVFTSLLNNALRFTDKGFVEMGYQIVNNQIRFYVKDSGVGFDAEFKEKLFASLDEKDGMTHGESKFGLGLSTVKHYVDLLQGTLKAESKPGAGTVFYFKVPYVPAVIEESAVPKRTIKVLIADDEEISFMLLKKLMKKGNVEIIRAKNGEEAYEIYKNNPDINLILMDIRMPQVDGYVAAQLIKHESPEIPIIAQSAYSFKENKENYGNAFNGYLSKPVNKKDFESVVNKYIDITFMN